MKKKWIVLLVGLLVVGLAACGSEGTSDSEVTDGGAAVVEAAAETAVTLSDTYENALPVSAQLALGTVQLDETELAVDETQAASLLPLWQALTSLTNSDTAAMVEIDAVVKQIQGTMTQEQVAAIAEMALTSESMTELAQSGALSFGRGAGAAGEAAGGGGFGRGLGGGELPGGRPGGGPGGGIPGGEALSEDDLATRQAQRANGDFSGFQDRLLFNMVVRLMETKTGVEREDGRFNIAETVYTVVSEATDVSVEDLQAEVEAGNTLAEVIAANDGDIEAVREALRAALAETTIAQNQDLEAFIDNLLHTDDSRSAGEGE